MISIYTGSDGSKGQVLTSNAIPVKNPYVSEENLDKQVDASIRMDGREIFKFAVKIIVQRVEKVLKDTEYSLEDIKYIVPHQANYRIIEFAAKKLGVMKINFM